jgi:PAS domain S-box-containing protein
MNPTAAAIPRLGDGDWYGLTDRELYPPELAETRMAADATVRATDATITATTEIDGRMWHTERFGIRAGNGEIGVFGVDISDRVRAERQVGFQARLLESVRDAVIVVDTNGRLTYWNQGAEDVFGYPADEIVGQDIWSLLAPGPREQVGALWQQVQAGETEIAELLTERRDGSPVWVNARISPIVNGDGSGAGYLAIVKDVTAGKRSELELRRLRLAIDHANDAIIVTDADDRVTYVNPAFERITGFAAADVVGERPGDHPAGAAFARALERARGQAGGWRGDLVDQRRDGSDLVAETSISPISADGAPGSGFVTIKRDVTQERAAERAADRRARERALIAETLESLHVNGSPESTAAAVCSQLVKLPEFELATVITFGTDGVATVLGQHHTAGPGMVGLDLTRPRSEFLRERAAAGPWVQRWVADASHPYNDLFTGLGIVAHGYAPMIVDGQPIGVLIASSKELDAVACLTERLPALMEFAAIATTLLADAVSNRNATAAARDRLRRVIDDRRFGISFQPIVDLQRHATTGYEALTRFDDGIPPDLEFQRAHELGLGLELEAACLEAAFEAAERLPEGAWLNVNVSPEVVLAGLVEPLLPRAGRAVVLEVTEHRAITDYEGFRRAIAPIRDRVRIAVDDAGAGYASLRHIVELAPAIVKLDRSLVAGIGDDAARQAIVTGMVRFARTAGLLLIAEGIETDAELNVLHRLGIPLGQGYLLGCPAEAEAFRAEAGPVPAERTAFRTTRKPRGRARTHAAVSGSV